MIQLTEYATLTGTMLSLLDTGKPRISLQRYLLVITECANPTHVDKAGFMYARTVR